MKCAKDLEWLQTGYKHGFSKPPTLVSVLLIGIG